MKSKLFLLAGLCAGLALVATAVPADEPAAPSDPLAMLYSGIPSDVQICHYPPGKNSKGSARSRTGKVLIVEESVCDYAYLCETDADDDLSGAAAQSIGDVPHAAATVGTPPCDFCAEAFQAYEAEVMGHLNNHEGDCWDYSISDCSLLEPGGIDGQCLSR